MEISKKCYNPCDDCQYSYSKQNQTSGICKICEYKKMQMEAQYMGIAQAKFRQELDGYRKLEEQGLLLKLPCKVGQTVWYMAREILQCKVRSVVSSFYDEAEIYLKYDGENDLLEHWNTSVGMDEIGNTVFFTKEEAEQARERKEKENG